MTFIISIALNIIVVFFIACIFANIKGGEEKRLEMENYFNVGDSNTTALKYVLYSAYAYVIVWVLSLIVVPLAVVLPFINLLTCVLSWWWLVETVKSGKAKIWVEDIKKYFNK